MRVAHQRLHRNTPPFDMNNAVFKQRKEEILYFENVALQTVGFCLNITHPHTFVVNFCQMIKAPIEVTKTAYFMATNSLHLTTMCLQYSSSEIACVCIHLSCKWGRWKIPCSSEGKEWYTCCVKTMTPELLNELTNEFVDIWEKSPDKFRRRVLYHNGAELPTTDRKTSEQNLACSGGTEPKPEQSMDAAQPSTSNFMDPRIFEFMQQPVALPKKRPHPEPSLSHLGTRSYFASCSGESLSKRFKSEPCSSVPITLTDYHAKRDKGLPNKGISHMGNPPNFLSQNVSVKKTSNPIINHKMLLVPSAKPESVASCVEKLNHQSTVLPATKESNHRDSKLMVPAKSVPEMKSEFQRSKTVSLSCEKSKDILQHPDSTGGFSNNNLSVFSRACYTEQNVPVKQPLERRTHSVSVEKTILKLQDISAFSKEKHLKHDSTSQPDSQNSHRELISTSQDNSVPKHSSKVGHVKVNTVIEHKVGVMAEPAEKTTDLVKVSRLERKKKHKHKSSDHSSSNKKDSSDLKPQPADQNPDGVKVAILWKKLLGNDSSPSGSGENKKCPTVESPAPLKVVIKKRAGSYSASCKIDSSP